MTKKEPTFEVLEGFRLYESLRNAGFPQGGGGEYLFNPVTDDKVYMPLPQELFTFFAQDPEQWADLRDTLARAWLIRKH